MRPSLFTWCNFGLSYHPTSQTRTFSLPRGFLCPILFRIQKKKKVRCIWRKERFRYVKYIEARASFSDHFPTWILKKCIYFFENWLVCIGWMLLLKKVLWIIDYWFGCCICNSLVLRRSLYSCKLNGLVVKLLKTTLLLKRV